MEEVKKYAATEECDINLECISTATGFFQRQGFVKGHSSSFSYPRKRNLLKRKQPLFPSYELICQEREERNKNEIKSFKKFLDSPLFKEIMKL